MASAATFKPNPERDAQEILETVWAHDPAEIPIPVDPIAIARVMGIKVYTMALEGSVSGVLVKRKGEDPEIYLNERDSTNRQRFTCAHELGHYVKRSSQGQEEWEDVDLRDAFSSTGRDADERYANQFAAALLMPKKEVKRVKDRHSSAALAPLFGVSADAMHYRLANLGL